MESVTSAPPTEGVSEQPAPAARRPGCAPVDVLIQTYNEEANLPHALASLRGWVNRVFVVDSGSTDRTEAIAREQGADFISHAWEGYARQKNWALANLPFESPWVMILDADEAITPGLRSEITRVCSQPPDEVREAGFYINRYLVFMGHRIRHCGYFPSWNLRLFKTGRARYEDRPVHEHMILDGDAGYLRELMSHEDRRGLEHYIAKHNRYSTLEAETLFFAQKYESGVEPKLFGGGAIARRRFFRTKIYPKLPAKWLGRFVWMYLINLGFLDGMAGLRFCMLISSHELFTSLKLRELHYQAKLARMGEAATPTETTVIQQDLPPAARPTAVPPARATPPGENGSRAHERAAPRLEAPMSDEQAVQLRVTSPWSFGTKVRRVLWMFAQTLLFRPSFHNWYGWRRFILRCFGAKIGKGARFRPSVWIEMPWNIEAGELCAVGDYAILYSLGKIRIGKLVVISQYAHLCAGTHDYRHTSFPLITPPIDIGDEAWVAADAFVGPGVTVGARAVVGARSTVVKDVPPNQVVVGNPARVVSSRA